MALQQYEGVPEQDHVSEGEPAGDQEAVVLEFRRILPPGMEATLAQLAWVKSNDEAGYGMFGVAEYKRDEEGRLYVDHHGPRVYLG
jgi:hypothetical protein